MLTNIVRFFTKKDFLLNLQLVILYIICTNTYLVVANEEIPDFMYSFGMAVLLPVVLAGV
jgi:hypothetical protein